MHPFKCRCKECPHFDNHPDLDASDELILAECVGVFEVGMHVNVPGVPRLYEKSTGMIEYIYFSEGNPCMCIYFEEMPEYGLRGQHVDVFVSVLLEALGRETQPFTAQGRGTPFFYRTSISAVRYFSF